MNENGDSDRLDRFVTAQRDDYGRALSEVQSGRKRSHWMCYIFPQIEGLGHSSTARFYAIKGMDEAKAFIAHPILGPRLVESMEAVLTVEGRTAEDIFGYPDVLKLRSCATLFAQVSERGSVFDRVLQKYYGGKVDEETMRILEGESE